ncbi:hypothetical protein [Desulfitobacterium hafniense]|uniref:hypothetical protein n=1 Tax=Desulfitobacterium hafniense TaxID=49338 RepID=UPI0003755061|nr:hypothetical protein [Desulfitobacterium hafniense]
MKKRLIFTLVLCFLVLFSNNVFATQETNNNDVTPAHVVDLVYYSHIYQMFGNVGGHGYIGATQAIEMLKTDSYLYEDNIVKSVDVQVGYNVQSIVAAPTAI